MSGFKYAFWRNLILIIFFGTILLVVTISCCICSLCRTRLIRQNKGCVLSKYGAWSLNFSLRFVYEFFLDICSCVFINLTAAGVNADGADLIWSIALILSLLIATLVCFLGSLFFHGGPYTVPNSYQKNSLKHSWWGLRPLSTEQSPKFQINIERKKDEKKIPDQEPSSPVEKNEDEDLNRSI